ncbi:MAG: hypothetical protein EBR02_01000 [Alphaproteobacteria bacterium]|nr:hypothetical protein [Alphaproteobacteria bacterium]
MKKLLSLLVASSLCVACSPESMYQNSFTKEAQVEETTRAGKILASLPPRKDPIPVVVYDFQDQTGQLKSNENFVEYSSAVTKGGLSVLIKSLLDTSGGQFYTVAERGGLNNLLKERDIIRLMRSRYTRADGTSLPDLPPMVYGGMLLEGGIIFYDSNIMTGGAAAGYFGISGSTQYRRDIVTVYLRAVDVQTGKVMLSVNSSKTIFSYGVSTNVLRYFSVDRLGAAEGGFTVNEPGQLAVRQAIESSVYALTMEGALRNMWDFSDKEAGQKAINDYVARRDHGREANTEAPNEASSTNSPLVTAGATQCTGFEAWMKRNFGTTSDPETYVGKPENSMGKPLNAASSKPDLSANGVNSSRNSEQRIQ